MATIKKKAYDVRKHPDQEIVTLANTISDRIAANGKVVAIVVAIAAIAVLAYGGLSLKRSSDEQKAAPLFAAAYDAYAMQAGTSPDYVRALELFQEVKKKYPSSRSGSLAQYYAANSLMEMGRLDEALKEYQTLSKEYAGDTLLEGMVYTRMGYLYTALGRQEDAIQAFERADSLNDPGVATIELARLYEKASNSAASLRKYKVIAERLTGTVWAREAAEKMQLGGSPAAGPTGKAAQGNAGKEK